jgi:hypothetical protein
VARPVVGPVAAAAFVSCWVWLRTHGLALWLVPALRLGRRCGWVGAAVVGQPFGHAPGGGQCSARSARGWPLTMRDMAQPSNSPLGRIFTLPRLPNVPALGR